MAEAQTNPLNVDMGVAERSIEDRMAAFVSNEPALSAEEPADQPQEAAEQEAPQEQETDESGLSAADLPTDDPVAAPSEGETFEIVHNGQQVKLTRDELIRNAQQGFDYTKKTQDIAQQRAEVQAVLQRAAMVEQLMPQVAQDLAQVKAIEAQIQQFEKHVQGLGGMMAIATNDPLEYPKFQAAQNQLLQAYQSANQQYQARAGALLQERQAITAQQLQQEAQRLTERIPQWRDPVKYQTEAQELSAWLVKKGADPQQVAALSDSLMVEIARDAYLYNKLKDSKANKSKQLRNVPPVPKPGAPQSATADSVLKARERLHKTGRREDAVGLLLTRMK